MSMNLTEKDIARDIAKAKLEEAKWWAACVDPYSVHAPVGAARITELEKEVKELE